MAPPSKSARRLPSVAKRYPWAEKSMREILEWRHPTHFLALGWPLYLDIEKQCLDVDPTEPAPGYFADGDPITHDQDGKPLGEESRRRLARIRTTQRAASTAAVDVLHALGFQVTQPMLRGFLWRLAFSPDPLAPAHKLVRRSTEEIAADAPPELISRLPFPVECALNPPQDVVDWPEDIEDAPSFRMPFDEHGTPIPTHIWSIGLEAVVSTRIAHDRLLRVRKEFLPLERQRLSPSRSYFQTRLDARIRSVLAAEGDRGRSALDWLVGEAAAESSPWWREKLEWHLLRGDEALKPRGSYASPDDAPKSLSIWHQFDYWMRQGLGALPTHLDRSRAIAATLMVFAGEALYYPGKESDRPSLSNLEQFARNIVERWRVRKAPSTDKLQRGLFLGVSGFSFTPPRQEYEPQSHA